MVSWFSVTTLRRMVVCKTDFYHENEPKSTDRALFREGGSPSIGHIHLESSSL